MSAAAYYFARTLTETLGVPVGIVSTSWGGSKIEAWMDPASLRAMGYDVEAINANPKIQQRAKCGLLYNGLIAPVAGYTARGFAWYQGESNRKEAGIYARLMQEMVRFWRAEWGDTQNRMPFLYVQIAPYFYNDAAATDGVLIMEAQSDALELIPNSAMIATTDLGEELTIHPRRKREVGERLAAEAMIRETGCDGIMIGRGVQGNPWLFSRILHYQETGELLPPPDKEEIKNTMLRHGRLQLEYKGVYTGIREMRKHIAWYTSGMPHSAAMRRKVNEVETWEELEELIRKL